MVLIVESSGSQGSELLVPLKRDKGQPPFAYGENKKKSTEISSGMST